VARHQVISDKLEEHYGAPVLQGKGGFWIRGHGFITLAKARKITGIKAPSRERQRMPAWGDYATIAALNTQRGRS